MSNTKARPDRTIGTEAELAVFTWRWGHMDSYTLTRNASGWTVRTIDQEAACDKGARPLLYDSLRHDSVDYPADLPGWLEHLWDEARDRRLSPRELQAAIKVLGKWISEVEFTKPKGRIWSVYKGSVFMPQRRPRVARATTTPAGTKEAPTPLRRRRTKR